MSYTDIELVCSNCGSSFTFSAGEQEFYESRGLTNQPRRCAECRQANKANREGRPGGGAPREMFSATCGACGKEARVPFQPRGDRPVYCNDGFRSQPRGGGGNREKSW
ncbi:MAG TPA: zinc-ribbon domain containing protein [Dehalococcoidia bacterium]|nr:zinc-ribbon domain containing protein [Dehalococcoidia bacterium]